MSGPAAGSFVRCVELPAEICASMIRSRTRPSASVDPLRERQRLAVWRLLDAYRSAATGDVPLPDLLSRVATELRHATVTLVTWVDATESIIQAVETLYGPQPGLGAYKAAQVKSAVLYTLRVVPQRGYPELSGLADPGAVEVVVGWIVDSIVLILNRRGLWQLSGPGGVEFTRWYRARTRVAACVLRWMSRFESWLAPQAEMLPQVRKIAEDLARQREADLGARSREAFEAMIWVMQHRAQLLALVDLVSIATQEAEALAHMSGREKQTYARNLVLMALSDDWRVWPAGSAWDQLVGAVIDVVIDSVVRIFRKRGLFDGRGAPASQAMDSRVAAAAA